MTLYYLVKGGKVEGQKKKVKHALFSNERANNMEGKVTPSYNDGQEVNNEKLNGLDA